MGLSFVGIFCEIVIWFVGSLLLALVFVGHVHVKFCLVYNSNYPLLTRAFFEHFTDFFRIVVVRNKNFGDVIFGLISLI